MTDLGEQENNLALPNSVNHLIGLLRPIQIWGLFALGCALTGLTLLIMWVLSPDSIANDVNYYWFYVSRVSTEGFANTLVEYPTPAAVLLWLPSLIAPDYEAYFNIFWIISSILCFLIGVSLVRAFPRSKIGLLGSYLWMALLIAAGPLGMFRFDLWPGLMALLALLSLMKNRDNWSTYSGLGAGLKLWPVVIVPFGFSGIRPRRRQLLIFVGTGLALVIFSLLVGGWERLISPMTWQGERGLHVESVLASGVLLARVFATSGWEADLSDNNSVDFTGPGVDILLRIGGVLQFVFLAGWLYLSWKVIRSNSRSIEVIALSSTATILWLLVINKVFSPQYILWILPIASALLTIGLANRVHSKEKGSSLMVFPLWWYFAFFFIAAMTHLAYPTFYQMLFAGSQLDLLLATGGMLSRNILMVILAFSLTRRVLCILKNAQLERA